MSYHLVIEGREGAHKVRRGCLPRRGEWLSLEIENAHWWLPVVEVGHALLKAERPLETESGSDQAHARAEAIVVTSLALGVKSPLDPGDEYRFVLPPSRWPFGGQIGVTGREDRPEGKQPKE